MYAYLLVGVGGALGAIGRFALGNWIGRNSTTSFPTSTLLINIIGSIGMGVLVGLLARHLPPWQEEARILVAVGLLGGFTTFSAFSLDTVTLLQRGAVGQAMSYVALSVVVCVAGLYLGLLITKGGAS